MAAESSFIGMASAARRFVDVHARLETRLSNILHLPAAGRSIDSPREMARIPFAHRIVTEQARLGGPQARKGEPGLGQFRCPPSVTLESGLRPVDLLLLGGHDLAAQLHDLGILDSRLLAHENGAGMSPNGGNACRLSRPALACRRSCPQTPPRRVRRLPQFFALDGNIEGIDTSITIAGPVSFHASRLHWRVDWGENRQREEAFLPQAASEQPTTRAHATQKDAPHFGAA